MYALRGIAVSLSIFFLLYSGLSFAVSGLSRAVCKKSQGSSPRRYANLLFLLRLLPFLAATTVTLAFAVPSFVMLEPRAAEESFSPLAMVLAAGGMAVLGAGLWNALFALKSASSAVGRWAIGARVLPRCTQDLSVSVLRTSATAPPLTAAGILRPTVWLSGAAEFVLNERELQGALRHELAHVRSRDNLRKLLLCCVAFPGMNRLESAWREATEMAADDAAVGNASQALDLAAAVIKLSRLTPFYAPAALTTTLVPSPVESVSARVQRLVDWKEPRPVSHRHEWWRYMACAACSLAVLVTIYGNLLLGIHAATEWLVR